MTAIIDLDSIAFACGADRVKRDESGAAIKGEDGKSILIKKTPEELVADTDKTMHDVLSSCNADDYVAFIKGASAIKTFRHKINPTYKANRDHVEPGWLPVVRKHLLEQWSAIEVFDYEVDDYVNVSKLLIPNSFIVAIDKDLLSLAGTHFNWKKKEWITVEPYQETYWFWRDMITGQPGDNLKGIPGKGIRYVEKLFDLREPESYRSLVLDEYCKVYGERTGIEEFTKMYMCLKLIENPADMETSINWDEIKPVTYKPSV